jgi:hypothetical protein
MPAYTFHLSTKTLLLIKRVLLPAGIVHPGASTNFFISPLVNANIRNAQLRITPARLRPRHHDVEAVEIMRRWRETQAMDTNAGNSPSALHAITGRVLMTPQRNSRNAARGDYDSLWSVRTSSRMETI